MILSHDSRFYDTLITVNGNVFKTYKWKPKKSMYDVVKDTYIWLSTNKKTIKKYF